MKGLVSVVVPIYNGEKYILDFLESIKFQSYENIQLILRDDASQDDSYVLCKNWKLNNEKRFAEILLLKGEKNEGLARNTAVACRYLKGEYVFIADQDDVWVKDRIEKQVQYLTTHLQCAVCLCDRFVTDEHLNVKIESNYKYQNYKITSMSLEEVVRHRSIYAANCMAIRNVDTKIFDIPNGIISHDSFIAYMAAYYGTVDFIFDSLVYYRIHENNLSCNFCAENSSNVVQCFKKYLKALKRVKKSWTNDNKIVCEEMMRRYGIDLKLMESPFAINDPKYNRIKKAWEYTRNDYKADKIGNWK